MSNSVFEIEENLSQDASPVEPGEQLVLDPRQGSGTEKVTFGATVRYLRERAGLTQTELGELLDGKSKEYVAMVERNLRDMNLKVVPLLAQIVHVNAVDLIRAALIQSYPVVAEILFPTSQTIVIQGSDGSTAVELEVKAINLARHFQELSPASQRVVEDLVKVLPRSN